MHIFHCFSVHKFRALIMTMRHCGLFVGEIGRSRNAINETINRRPTSRISFYGDSTTVERNVTMPRRVLPYFTEQLVERWAMDLKRERNLGNLEIWAGRSPTDNRPMETNARRWTASAVKQFKTMRTYESYLTRGRCRTTENIT